MDIGKLNNELIKENNLPDIHEICWYYGQYAKNLSDCMINKIINRYIEENVYDLELTVFSRQ
mgnify:CR=1 FL=1